MMNVVEPVMSRALLLLGPAVAAAAEASATPLHDALLALPFVNADRVRATDVFEMRPVSDSIYLEPEAPSFAEWAWADGRIARAMPNRPHGSHYYLYMKNDSAVAPAAPPAGAPPAANSSMLAGWSVPPNGMRSAPPLGGLSTGSIELRGDGSLHAWTIENASPAGSTKIATLSDAAMGVQVGHTAKLLRTHPPAGLPGVSSIEFSGAMPFTRLTPIDAALAGASDLRLFGRSRWRIGDMNASATPAIAFTLTATNPSSSSPLDLSFFFALPLSLQRGVIRSTADAANATDSSGADSCFSACAENSTCDAWSFGGAGCEQYGGGSTIPSSRNTDAAGAASGVRGRWSLGRAKNCATLDRPGTHAAAGNASLCAAFEGATASTVSFASGKTLADLWGDFSASGGTLDGKLGADAVGAAAVKLTVPPGGKASLTISLGWYFPHRDFMGTDVGELKFK
jgi:non-lysosomal glucosylceramidase